MTTQNWLMMLLLLLLMMRNVLTTVWCSFKVDVQVRVEAELWSLLLLLMLGCDFEVQSWSRCLVEILKLVLGRDSEDV